MKALSRPVASGVASTVSHHRDLDWGQITDKPWFYKTYLRYGWKQGYRQEEMLMAEKVNNDQGEKWKRESC